MADATVDIHSSDDDVQLLALSPKPLKREASEATVDKAADVEIAENNTGVSQPDHELKKELASFETSMVQEFNINHATAGVLEMADEDLTPGDKQLKHAADGNDFSMQAGLGSRLKRSPDYAAYRALSGPGLNTLRRQFRERWAKKEWAKTRSEKSKIERHSEKEADIGVWFPAPRVIKEDGGQTQCISGSRRHELCAQGCSDGASVGHGQQHD